MDFVDFGRLMTYLKRIYSESSLSTEYNCAIFSSIPQLLSIVAKIGKKPWIVALCFLPILGNAVTSLKTDNIILKALFPLNKMVQLSA